MHWFSLFVLSTLCFVYVPRSFCMDEHGSGNLISQIKTNPVITIGVLAGTGVMACSAWWWYNKTTSTKSVVASPVLSESLPAVASSRRKWKMSTLLLKQKKTIIFADLLKQPGAHAVHIAAAEGDLAQLNLLLECKQNVDRIGPQCVTPLICAAANGQVEAAHMILERGGLNQLQTVDRKHMSALGYAALHGKLSMVQYLTAVLKAKQSAMSFSQRLFKRLTPLHCAIMGKQYAIARFLIEHGAHLESSDIKGNSPLHCAVEAEVALDFLAYLLGKYQASDYTDVNICDAAGFTAFDRARQRGLVAIEQVLISFGCMDAEEVRAKKIYDAEQAQDAEKEGPYIAMLLEKFGSLNAIFKDGTLLDAALRDGWDKTVWILRKYGAKTKAELESM